MKFAHGNYQVDWRGCVTVSFTSLGDHETSAGGVPSLPSVRSTVSRPLRNAMELPTDLFVVPAYSNHGGQELTKPAIFLPLELCMQGHLVSEYDKGVFPHTGKKI